MYPFYFHNKENDVLDKTSTSEKRCYDLACTFACFMVLRLLTIIIYILGTVMVMIVWIYNYLCNQCLSPLM